MPEQAPGVFGIDKLTHAVNELRRSVDHLAAGLAPKLAALEGRLTERLRKSEEKIMATLDTLAGQVAELRGDAQAEAQEVKAKLDEMTALIEQLQQNANDPAKVDAISQDLSSLKGEIQSIFTGEAPPEPVPSPQGRRK